MEGYTFFQHSFGWDGQDEPALQAMVGRGQQLSRRTFLKHVSAEQMREYDKAWTHVVDKKSGITRRDDWRVRYCRSVLHGKRVYYFVHSGIEYVFTKEK